MIKAKAKKTSKNESNYKIKLSEIILVDAIPMVGKPMVLFGKKLHQGIVTSEITAVELKETKTRLKYSVTTLNSTYEVSIKKSDIEDSSEQG